MKRTCYRCQQHFIQPWIPAGTSPEEASSNTKYILYDPEIEKRVCWYCMEPTENEDDLLCNGCANKVVELSGPNGLFQCLECKKWSLNKNKSRVKLLIDYGE